MINLSIQLTGGDKAIKALNDVATNVTDFSPAFRLIRADFYEIMVRQFAMGGRTIWQQLSEPYARWKSRTHPGQPLMVLSGDMRDSLTSSNAKGSILNIQPMSMEIGTATRSKAGYPYPYAHQYGVANNPERKVIDLPPGTAARWAKIMNNHILFTADREGPWSNVTMADFGFEGDF